MPWDHPRSRGVYAILDSDLPVLYGSSPLARGLHSSIDRAVFAFRIIPARAGFTTVMCVSVPKPLGSSPLARGLPPDTPRTTGGPGIIPARAGFTGSMGVDFVLGWDHPRSRGVYSKLIIHQPFAPGSSPLARGLRPPVGIVIPFSWDHPRSRGVYPFVTTFVTTVLGSSPLARGLPVEGRWNCAPCGIIPARAGFTTASSTGPASSPDHPRSRGVYHSS